MLPPDLKEPPEQQEPPGAVQQCRRWLEWFAAQIEACLTVDGAANSRLLASFERFMSADRSEATLAAEISAVVVAVQAHDRIMQQLQHVVESLRALHRHMADVERRASAEHWRQLRENQWRRFSMTEERALFARIFADESPAPELADAVLPGDVELFES